MYPLIGACSCYRERPDPLSILVPLAVTLDAQASFRRVERPFGDACRCCRQEHRCRRTRSLGKHLHQERFGARNLMSACCRSFCRRWPLIWSQERGGSHCELGHPHFLPPDWVRPV